MDLIVDAVRSIDVQKDFLGKTDTTLNIDVLLQQSVLIRRHRRRVDPLLLCCDLLYYNSVLIQIEIQIN